MLEELWLMLQRRGLVGRSAFTAVKIGAPKLDGPGFARNHPTFDRQTNIIGKATNKIPNETPQNSGKGS